MEAGRVSRQPEETRFTAGAEAFLSVCRKQKGKLRGIFRIKATGTKKHPQVLSFEPSLALMAKLSCRKCWRDRAVLYPA